MAVTIYTAVLALVLGHPAGALEVSGSLGRELLGGVLIGVLLGLVFSRLTSLVDDHLIEMLLSASLAYGSYISAQWLDASGPLACVSAGLVHGTYGRRVGMSETTRRLLDDLWEFLGFLANALVFVLVGFTANLGSLIAAAWPVVVSVVAVLLARAVVLLGPRVVLTEQQLVTTPRERLVLAWSGLRGALTIALALALPNETPQRELLVTMSFGVVLFSLVVQGLSLPMLLRRLRLAHSADPT